MTQLVSISNREWQRGGPELEAQLKKASQDGFFYLEIPKCLKEYIPDAVGFAKTFPTDQKVQTFAKQIHDGFVADGGKDNDPRRYNGFDDVDPLQVRSYRLAQQYWKSGFPERIHTLAEGMKTIAATALRRLLHAHKFPNSLQEEATGGLVSNEGRAYPENGWVTFTFNNYDPSNKTSHQEPKPGLPSHRDSGFITVLYPDPEVPGLRAHINNQWQEVKPKKDHFVINLGHPAEMLLGKEYRVTASWHKVIPVAQERFSFGVFLDADLDKPRWNYSDGQLNQEFERAADHITKLAENIYTPPADDEVLGSSLTAGSSVGITS